MPEANDAFKRKLADISAALQEAESILREDGLEVPEENIALEDSEKIQVPRGYIRTVRNFREKYNLDDFLGDDLLCRNVAYALQTSYFTNYIVNRVNVALSVGQIFYKLAIINAFSVIEGVLYGLTKRLHRFCRNGGEVCRYNTRCSYYIKSVKHLNFRTLLNVLKDKAILDLSKNTEVLLIELKGLRDNVHIWDVGENEYLSDHYNMRTYNQLILALRHLSSMLPNSVETFKAGRSENCRQLSEILGA